MLQANQGRSKWVFRRKGVSVALSALDAIVEKMHPVRKEWDVVHGQPVSHVALACCPHFYIGASSLDSNILGSRPRVRAGYRLRIYERFDDRSSRAPR